MIWRDTTGRGAAILADDATNPDGAEADASPTGLEEHDCASAGESPPALFEAGSRAKPTGIRDLAIHHDDYLYGHLRLPREQRRLP